jgi:hypothetical protein
VFKIVVENSRGFVIEESEWTNLEQALSELGRTTITLMADQVATLINPDGTIRAAIIKA